MEYFDQNGRPLQTSKYSGLSIASMVLGILAVVFCCLWPLSLILGIISLVLALASKCGRQLDPFAITGLITSCIAIVLVLIMCLVPFFLAHNATRHLNFKPTTQHYSRTN